jgi:predicted outer membrane repeat protein
MTPANLLTLQSPYLATIIDLEIRNGNGTTSSLFTVPSGAQFNLTRIVLRDMVNIGDDGSTIRAYDGSIGHLSNVTFLRCISTYSYGAGSCIYAQGPLNWYLQDLTFVNCSMTSTAIYSASPPLMSLVGGAASFTVTFAGNISFYDGLSSSSTLAFFNAQSTDPSFILSDPSNPAHWHFETGTALGLSVFSNGGPITFSAASVDYWYSGLINFQFAINMGGKFLTTVIIDEKITADRGGVLLCNSKLACLLQAPKASIITTNTMGLVMVINHPINITARDFLVMETQSINSGTSCYFYVAASLHLNVTNNLTMRPPVSTYNLRAIQSVGSTTITVGGTFNISGFRAVNFKGPAIYVEEGASVSIRATTIAFEGNLAGLGSGGAIWSAGNLSLSAPSIIFRKNLAKAGLHMEATASWTSSGLLSFESNSASDVAGVLHIYSNQSAAFLGASFINNTANSGCIIFQQDMCLPFEPTGTFTDNVQVSSSCSVAESMCTAPSPPVMVPTPVWEPFMEPESPPLPPSSPNPVAELPQDCSGAPPSIVSWICISGQWLLQDLLVEKPLRWLQLRSSSKEI